MLKTQTPSSDEKPERRAANPSLQVQLLRTLSFVRLLEDGKYDPWATCPSGDDTNDFLRGGQYGVEFIEATVDGLSATFLADIVEALPRPLGPLEWGFLSTILNAILLGSTGWQGQPGLVVGITHDPSTIDLEVLASSQYDPLIGSFRNRRRKPRVTEGSPKGGVWPLSDLPNPGEGGATGRRGQGGPSVK